MVERKSEQKEEAGDVGRRDGTIEGGHDLGREVRRCKFLLRNQARFCRRSLSETDGKPATVLRRPSQ